MGDGLRRSETDKWIAGVCGGLSQDIDIDPTLLRVFWIIGTLLSGIFIGVILYIVLMLVMDEDN